ncbi:triacylglycerol lipase [Andreprevotia sp. IGB-42]|uniref:esterase/lipase family protein n=1 Tax=Andreprevotia sp. IGB-42 TaxID=2497473 RepID=UPI0013572DAA|nr:alpha/beta hydrolase [Andreprevotia sp. IGB-42]
MKMILWRMVLGGLLLQLLACAPIKRMVRLEENLDTFETQGAIAGAVWLTDVPAEQAGLVLYEMATPMREVARLHGDDAAHFGFLVPMGRRYVLAAFWDKNGNGKPDNGEATQLAGWPDGLLMEAGETRYQQINLSSRSPAAPAQLQQPGGLQAAADGISSFPFFAGREADWGERSFNRQSGTQGVWAPLDFIAHNGVGIYFFEPYRKDKIPVLFIHGSGGYPQQWRQFITGMDHDRYQPWVFNYPSGIRLATSADALVELIAKLQHDHGFSDMIIVAHSVGGLVARQTILLAEQRLPQQPVRQLLTLSTPWGGHTLAELGLEKAPVVVPSWQDLAPGSDFLQQLFAQTWPQSVSHYLMFSYRGRNLWLPGNSDGSVSISSQLLPQAQQAATRIIGYDETHVSILNSDAVLKQAMRWFQSVSVDAGCTGVATLPQGCLRQVATRHDSTRLVPGSATQ